MSQDIERVRTTLQSMIERNDFSNLQFVKGTAPPGGGVYQWGTSNCK
jgi:hypothetical protein